MRVPPGVPSATSMSRFSTSPSAVTMTTSARVADSGTNSICLSGASVLGATTSPAQRDRPDSMVVACSSAWPRDFPAAARRPSILRRSSSVSPPTSSSPLTKSLSPASVGSRPAEVWGA